MLGSMPTAARSRKEQEALFTECGQGQRQELGFCAPSRTVCECFPDASYAAAVAPLTDRPVESWSAPAGSAELLC